MDVCHWDEVGFSPTLPTTSSGAPVGTRIVVPYEAPQGRRVNGIGAYFTAGPAAGTLLTQTWVRVPTSRAKKPRKTPAEGAREHGVTEAEMCYAPLCDRGPWCGAVHRLYLAGGRTAAGGGQLGPCAPAGNGAG
jgi:hypothetical protein